MLIHPTLELLHGLGLHGMADGYLSHPLIFPLDVPASRLRLMSAFETASWRPEP